MSLYQSPAVVTDGLEFYMDMNNVQKSWIGPPVTNQFPLPTPSLADGSTTFPVQGTGTFKRIYTGTYGGYTIDRDKDVVYRYDLGINGCHYHGNTITVAAGQTITFSFDYYVDPSSANYPTVNYIANIEGTNGGGLVDPNPSEIGVWKRGVIKSGTTVAGNYNVLLYPGACSSSYLASSGFILYKNPQVEISSPGGNPTAYTQTSRNDTAAIKDLTGKNIITANSLTYGSDGLFSFNGSTDYALLNSSGFFDFAVNNFRASLGYAWTISAWFKFPISPTTTRTGNASYAICGMGGGIGGGETLTLFVGSGTDSTYGSYVPYYCAVGTFGAKTIISPSPVNTNTWNNVVVTWNGSSGKVYFNGVDRGALNVGTASVQQSYYFTIGGVGSSGSLNSTQVFEGSIGVIKVYNRGISDQEVSQNFNSLRGRYGI